MERILISWIGRHDLDAVTSPHPGPIMAAIKAGIAAGKPYKALYFLYNYPAEEVAPYRQWLSEQLSPEVSVSFSAQALSSPSSYREIYPAAEQALLGIEQKNANYQRVVHLSPGTPAMTAVWILLVKTRFPSICIDSWVNRATGEQHVNEVELPFDIDARFTHEALARSDKRLAALHLGDDQATAFDDIVTSGGLDEALHKAKKMALRDVPLLLLGETGTGKEVFAQAVHRASTRANKPFVAVNCGALPRELAESLLFGHKKGAFTGASQDHQGYFAQANGGTLFLDEVGELSLDLQVKLLRVLQEGSYTPVGGTGEQHSNFRLIAATHRDLMRQVAEGSFREDLFYRLAIGVIKLPALRERGEDLLVLLDALMTQINDELADQPGYQRKFIDDEVKKLISAHAWPGNIRELRATLLRAAVWSEGEQLDAETLQDAMLTLPTRQHDLLADDLSQPFDLNAMMDEVAKHYIPIAMKKTGGNKTRAAELLGLKSHQVLTNKMEKLGIE